MVMPDSISRLMDGELDDGDVAGVCGHMRQADAVKTWVCYHVIGETLRGEDCRWPRLSRGFAARLASEPTVVAPIAARARPLPIAWAVAATVAAVAVVGWVAMATLEPSANAIAKAREAATIRAAQVRPQAVPADYLLAHREYSPTTPMEGIGPVLRAASAESADAGR
jgi:sigma-E factor negative regulatory protein RseA